MKEYQERVAEEAEKLKDKRLKLASFMKSLTFMDLPHIEQDILEKQLACMDEYAFFLNLRLREWGLR
jgi:hypothetical protein